MKKKVISVIAFTMLFCGDVFWSEEGLERVIAVSEDGAFVTEIIDR